MRFWSTILALLLTVSVADAQPVGAPENSAGDEWTYTNGERTWTTRVVKVEGDTVVMTGALAACMKCLIHYDRNRTLKKIENADGTQPDITSMGFVPVGEGWKFFDFPLAPKKEWRISTQAFFRGRPMPYTVDCTVQAYEDVKTKAGAFKAFKIWRQWSVRGSEGSGDARWHDTVWFSPETKSTIKYTSSLSNVREYELVSYSLK